MNNNPPPIPRVQRRSGRIVLVAALTLMGVGGAVGAMRMQAGRAQASNALPSDYAIAKRMSFKIHTTSSGRLEARRQVEIRSMLDGRSNIVELAPEGKAAKAGELLLRLNTDELDQAIREEQLAVETATAEAAAADSASDIQINENQSRLRQAESKVKLGQLALDQWEQGDVQKKKQELALAIDKTSRDHERLKEKVLKSKELWEKGFLSKDEYQRDEISLTEVKSAAEQARLEAQIYWQYKHPEEKETKTSALLEAQSELERVKMNNQIELASKQTARTTKRKSLEIHEARLKDLQKQVAEASIKAPVDGLVVYAFSMGLGWRETPLQIGQPVYRNELVMILPDTSEMIAAVGVHESLAGRVKEGQAVDIKVDAVAGKTFQGIVESLGVLAETDDARDKDTRQYKVKVAMDAASIRGVELKPSMRVDATITLGEVVDAISVPIQSIFSDSGLRYVCEKRGGSVVKTPVKVGRMSNTHAEVLAGLTEGSVILVREPAAGEIDERPWDEAALALVDYELDAEGSPVAKAPSPSEPTVCQAAPSDAEAAPAPAEGGSAG
ncbi:MAG: efflux RND transporter periplasmic adaptor subunit [Phycisphaerales bacterium]|nr:efflux RND transporter periplasmic adaptor subunit [Phycisphaerales bacterium]